MKLSPAQRKALALIPDEWGVPASSNIHNATLAKLIDNGFIEWSYGQYASIWQLNHGQFRRTHNGRLSNNACTGQAAGAGEADGESTPSATCQ